jgi:hypothetical protein
VHDYIYGNTNLLSLAVDGDNTPRVIFPGLPATDAAAKSSGRFGGRHRRADSQPAALLFPLAGFPDADLGDQRQHAAGKPDVQRHHQHQPGADQYFDTMSVEIYSLNDPTKDIKTGDMRLVDLHNREFYIYQTTTNGTMCS